MSFTERFFKLEENNTTVGREIYTGLLSFLAVAYILAVNPAILSSTGMDKGGIFYATALSAFAGTMCMAFLANYPLVLAPAMGLNAFFAYSVVKGMGYSWQLALFAIVVEGIVFLLLSLSSIREKIIITIPMPLKYAMSGGIGLFITLIAFKNAQIIQADPITFVSLQDFSGQNFHTHGISAALALIGVLLSAYLMHRKCPGSLLFGIFGTWILGIICQLAGIYHVQTDAGFNSLIPEWNLTELASPLRGFCDLFGSAFDVSKWSGKNTSRSGWQLIFSVDFAIVCFSFLFSDFFDTLATTNGAVIDTPLMKKNGYIPRLKKLLIADSLATLIGGIFGTSTTTTYAESAIAIRSGARTGLAAVTAAVLFLLSLVCAPFFLRIPGFATAPALIIVGFLMLQAIFHIDWKDITSALPAYLLLTGIVFTYNVCDGLGFGIISYTILNCRIKARVNIIHWILTLLFFTKYICF